MTNRNFKIILKQVIHVLFFFLFLYIFTIHLLYLVSFLKVSFLKGVLASQTGTNFCLSFVHRHKKRFNAWKKCLSTDVSILFCFTWPQEINVYIFSSLKIVCCFVNLVCLEMKLNETINKLQFSCTFLNQATKKLEYKINFINVKLFSYHSFL